MFAVLPLILLLSTLFILWLRTLIVGKSKGLMHYFVSAMIVELFLFHPYIVQSMFTSFNCMEVDGQMRLTDNIQSICYKGVHFYAIIGITIPSLLIWGIGIPIAAFILLRKHRETIIASHHYIFLKHVEPDNSKLIDIK